RYDVRGDKASLMLETERAIKPFLTCQPRNRAERYKHAGDGNAKQFHHVPLFVMPDFMRQHGFQFCLGELPDEGVEQDDFSETSEPGEKGVRVTRAFAAVHYLDAARGKTGALRQRKETLAQCSFGQWCEFVEKRHDDRRRHEH